LASVGALAGTAVRGAALVHQAGEVLRLSTGGASSNNSLQETAPAAFTSARCARLRFGLRVLLLSSIPFGLKRLKSVVEALRKGFIRAPQRAAGASPAGRGFAS
jgi:hypothetical protein